MISNTTSAVLVLYSMHSNIRTYFLRKVRSALKSNKYDACMKSVVLGISHAFDTFLDLVIRWAVGDCGGSVITGPTANP